MDRDRKNNVLIKIKNKKDTRLIEKKVIKRKYKIQRIDGLPPKQVTPPPEVYDRIKKDNILIGKARDIDSKLIFLKTNLFTQLINILLLVFMEVREF